MNRAIQLRSGAIIEGDAEEVLEIAQSDVPTLALEVGLLSRKLSDSLCVWTKGGPKVVLRLLDAAAARASVFREANQVRYDIPSNLLGYLENALLRAYRDEKAEANHIHIEGKAEGTDYDLTFMFELSQPPMSPEEVARLTSE